MKIMYYLCSANYHVKQPRGKEMGDDKSKIEYSIDEQDNGGSMDFSTIVRIVTLNWHWFLISLIVFMGAAYIYLKYTDPVYNVAAKLYIKESENNSKGYGSLVDLSTGGYINYGISDEMLILTSSNVAAQAVKDLKLYVDYWLVNGLKDDVLYKDQPLSIDMDPTSLDKLNNPIQLEITLEGGKYHVTGTYYVPIDEVYSEGPYGIDKQIDKLPATINTKNGIITISENPAKVKRTLEEGGTMKATIWSPRSMAYRYCGATTVDFATKTSNVLLLNITDTKVRRGKDYLNQLVICYNKRANDDKNEISRRTEEFINERLAKVSMELGSTEGELEGYKRRNQLVTLNINARSSVENASTYEQRLAEASTQMTLINSLIDILNESGDKYEVLPANIGISDNTSTALITTYNNKVLERNQLLRSASEDNPAVTPLTAQLADLKESIRRALQQAKRVAEIQRNSISSQLGQYNSEISKSPEQERVLTQIGRQQEIKTDLYLTLLQKREENSINLAATSDRSTLIESPAFAGKESPKTLVIIVVAFVLGLGVPAGIFYLIQFLKYRIEGRSDVEKLTKLPIIAEVAVANDAGKTKGDIVVHANKNNTMEEVFRTMRTNLQFKLKPGEKVILFSSSIAGEGKTFNAANLAISFALLGKKTIICGLDIRKPRLAELFEIHNHHNGITNLLTKENLSWSEVKDEIVPSGVNDNLDILMAGPIPPNPSELISRESLDDVFKHLREHYDYIIIDTAPVGIVVDTVQISRVADTSVIVSRCDYTPKKCFEYINELATENKLPNISIVVNGIDMSKRKHRYAYGYGYYGRVGAYYGKGGYGYYGGYSKYGKYGYREEKEKDDSIKQ